MKVWSITWWKYDGSWCVAVFVALVTDAEVITGDGPLPMAIFELLEYIVNEVTCCNWCCWKKAAAAAACTACPAIIVPCLLYSVTCAAAAVAFITVSACRSQNKLVCVGPRRTSTYGHIWAFRLYSEWGMLDGTKWTASIWHPPFYYNLCVYLTTNTVTSSFYSSLLANPAIRICSYFILVT